MLLGKKDSLTAVRLWGLNLYNFHLKQYLLAPTENVFYLRKRKFLKKEKIDKNGHYEQAKGLFTGLLMFVFQ